MVRGEHDEDSVYRTPPVFYHFRENYEMSAFMASSMRLRSSGREDSYPAPSASPDVNHSAALLPVETRLTGLAL